MLAEIISDTVADKALRLWADTHWMIPYGACGAGVVTGDTDPNTSPTWWDDSTDHYVLAWIYYTGYYSPQNSDPHKRYSFFDPLYDPNYDDPAEAAFDHVEVRTGKFDKTPCRLTLNVVKPNYGAVAINPDLRDPADPNTSEEKVLRYTKGTGVVLHAVPIAGKSFSEWSVWGDPNRYPDANYITIRDSNAVLYLVMDKDYLAEATFKCGSGLPPFIAAAFLALAAGVAFRLMSGAVGTRRQG